MKALFVVPIFWIALLVPAAANALCVCLECVWKPKRHFVIHSAAMSPALKSGDCVVFDLVQASPSLSERGKIVVFYHPVDREFVYVSRAIGLPGDAVQMKDGVVWLNNAPLAQKSMGFFEEPFAPRKASKTLPRCISTVEAGGVCQKNQFEETLPNGLSYTTLDITMQKLDNTRRYTVPDDHVFMLGDNRDNSIDSRMEIVSGGYGFIPMRDIFGVLNTPLRVDTAGLLF